MNINRAIYKKKRLNYPNFSRFFKKYFNSKSFLPGNLKLDLNYEKVNKNELLNNYFKNYKRLNLPSYLTKGFMGYNIFLIKENIDSNQFDNTLKCIQELFKGLEDDKVYSLLFNLVNSENNTSITLIPRSLLVTNKSPVDIIIKILIIL